MGKVRKVERAKGLIADAIKHHAARHLDTGLAATAMFQLAFDYAMERDGPDVVAAWLRDLANQVVGEGSAIIIPVNGSIRHV